VTTQLALSLTLLGKKTGILDIDLTGPSIPHIFNLESAKVTQAPTGWQPVPIHAANNTTPTAALSCMSLGFLLRNRADAVIWRGPKKTAMVRQFLTDIAWGELDFLLIDTPPGTSDEHIALAETLLRYSATRNSPHRPSALIVTTPQAVSTADVRKELNFCRKTEIPVLGVVENMSGFVCPCCGVGTNVFSKGGGRVMAEEFGVRFLGEVPVEGGWGAVVEGRDGLLVERFRACALWPVFEVIAREVIAAQAQTATVAMTAEGGSGTAA
jgi:Mrp family chromosome partitioning ATPase